MGAARQQAALHKGEGPPGLDGLVQGDGGFGYDSVFYSDDLKKSFGLAMAQEKNSVSHRFRSLQALREKLR